MALDLETANGIWNLVSGIGGAVLGGLVMALKRARDIGAEEGSLDERILGMDVRLTKFEKDQTEFVEAIRADIERLETNHDRTRDQLADIKSTMAQKVDLKEMARDVQVALASIQARIDQLITGHK